MSSKDWDLTTELLKWSFIRCESSDRSNTSEIESAKSIAELNTSNTITVAKLQTNLRFLIQK